MCGHYTHRAHGQNILRSRLCSSHIPRGVPRIFLTAPLASAAVGFHQDPSEQLLRYGKLATSHILTQLPRQRRSRAIVHCRHALLARAVRTAIHRSIGLDPMANDSTPTMVTGGRQRLNGALKAIEGMRRIRRHHHKGFIVFIPASFTQCHIDDSFFTWVILVQPCGS